MSSRDFKMPLATLINQAGRLNNALNDATIGPPVAARLPATFVADFATALTKAGGAPAAKAGQKGTTGTLTKEQDDAMHEMLRLMGEARHSAGLAFKGNDVVLHEEFKVGVHDPRGLAAEVDRAKVIAASAVKYATELGEHGWVAQDATDLTNAIAALGGADLTQEESKAKGPGLTAVSNVDANALYAKCLSLQNAARLQFPANKPGNETPRARYLIGEFPPHGHGGHDDVQPPSGGGTSGGGSSAK